ncbi:SDR family oxidoreductase [Aestuariibacter sp. AA17]|uniref:SDR family oxidoreductase n=1 Tax=Fluctibacter corallii TaxID=2984329 RepID=A0ABT3A3Z2_9ALTE|nr:SDR family oxidoreductase [Aestuariibacter sp. AA17]MCV2883407.1 SDR family oxidoreductase [Aestuariibacter sp. AA17]
MLNSKIALVTGANRGIGLETAKQLSDHGVSVILSGRDMAKLESIKADWQGKTPVAGLIQLDITREEDIQATAKHIEASFGRLDILVNNAGVIVEGEWVQNNAQTISQSELADTFNINLFSQIALTQALLPLIKKSQAGRIVNVSSILGSVSVNADLSSGWEAVKPFAYNASKAALNMFTIALSQSLLDTPVKVNSAHPGWVKTDLGTDAAPMHVEDGAKTLVELALLDENGATGAFYHLGETLPW